MALKLRRGFVKEAEEYSVEFRTELGLNKDEPLDPFDLAELLAVPVMALSAHPGINEQEKKIFATKFQNEFSAATLTGENGKEILHNDAHHPARQNSNIAHELAHIILGHPPKPPMLKDGCRNFDKIMEKEAHDLGFTLLVPKYAALRAVEEFTHIDEACNFYKVSKLLMNYRIRKTDAKRWSINRSRKNQS